MTRSPWLSVSLVLALSCGGQTGDPPAAGGAGGVGGAGAGGSAGAAGTAGTAGAAGAPDDGKAKFPCDVEQVIAKHCQKCHGEVPSFGAPSSLVNLDDLNASAKTEVDRYVYDLLQERLRSASKPMPPPPNPRPSFEEIDVIDRWFEDGLPPRPKGEVCPPVTPPVDNPPPPCEPTLRLKASSKWQMPKQVVDRYVCYGVDIEGEAYKRHITGIVPFIDNAAIVHHLLLFQMDGPVDTAPHPCSDIFPIDGKAIYAWAPGGPSYLLPEAAGFPVKAGDKTHLMVQVHYSNLAQLAGQEDASEIGLCITDKVRPYDADIMWVGGYDFFLPPHKTTEVECALPLNGGASNFLPIHVFQAWPHMHTLGVRLESTLLRPDGSKSDLGTADPYSFSSQVTYPMNADVYPGDTILTRCRWDNTTDSSVKWGEATSEEMCFNLLAYYPRINLPQYGSPAAAALSKCKPVP